MPPLAVWLSAVVVGLHKPCCGVPATTGTFATLIFSLDPNGQSFISRLDELAMHAMGLPDLKLGLAANPRTPRWCLEQLVRKMRRDEQMALVTKTVTRGFRSYRWLPRIEISVILANLSTE